MIPVEAVVIEHADPPVYLRIADEAKHLRQLGMSERAIGRASGALEESVGDPFCRRSPAAPKLRRERVTARRR